MRRVLLQKLVKLVLCKRHVSDDLCRPGSFFARVDKHENLVLSSSLHNLFITYLVHQHEFLDGLLFSYTDVNLLKRHGPIGVVKVVQPCFGIDSQESSDILIVGQRSGQGNDPYKFRGLFNLPNRSRHDGFEHRASVIVEQVDLINYYQFDQVKIGTFTGLAGHNIPLFGRRHDDLGLVNLLLCQVRVSSQLFHLHAIVYEAFLEVSNYL